MKYYVCINCGQEFEKPQSYKSCDSCHNEFRNGVQYMYCKKCHQKKPYDKRGLCLDCYIYAVKRNEYLTKHDVI